MVSNLKIGVLYAKHNQKTAQDWFKNSKFVFSGFLFHRNPHYDLCGHGKGT
jgi:hypothetical protein